MKLISSLLVGLILILMIGCSPVIQSTSPKVPLNQSALNGKIIYALPKGMIRISNSQEKGQPVFLIEPVFVPDPNHYCSIEICPNPAYDDEVQVSVDTNGLLKAINVTTTSQVGAILLELVEAAKQASKFAALRGGAKDKNFDILINPDDLHIDSLIFEDLAKQSQEIDKLGVEITGLETRIETAENEFKKAAAKDKKEKKDKLDKVIQQKKDKEITLGQMKSNLKRKLDGEGISSAESINELKKYKELIKKYEKYGLRYISISWEKTNIVNDKPDGNEKSQAKGRSVYYRPLLPCKLKVIFEDNLYEKIVYLPNKAPIIAWDISRPTFTNQISKLTFANGVLTEVYLNKPSELLAGLKIPTGIIKSVAGMPLELLQFRVDYSETYNRLLQAQIQEIENKQQLMQLQQGK